MQKNILILSLAALLACAHEDVAQLPTERDWEKGLDGTRGPQIAPLGPIDTDQAAYNYIRRREQERDLGSRMTAAGLDEIIASSSQVLASAMALPLFRAGVYRFFLHLGTFGTQQQRVPIYRRIPPLSISSSARFSASAGTKPALDSPPPGGSRVSAAPGAMPPVLRRLACRG